MSARIALAAVALACLVVLGWWARASVLEQRAQRVSDDVFAVSDPGRAAEAERRFRRAGEHNPDARPDYLRGYLLLRAGRPRAAARVLTVLTRREPDNVEAWVLLARATRRSDPARAAGARARVVRLNPLAGD